MKKLKVFFKKVIKKLKNTHITKNDIRTVLPLAVLFVVLILLDISLYGFTVGEKPKWYFYILLILTGGGYSFLIFKKSITAKLNIAFSVVLIIMFTLIGTASYFGANNVNVKRQEMVSSYSGTVTDVKKIPLGDNTYKIHNTIDGYRYIKYNKTLLVGEDVTVEEYSGNFGIPVYFVTKNENEQLLP